MSYILHTKRQNAIDFVKRRMKKVSKMPKDKMRALLLERFGYGFQTSDKLIKELVAAAILKNNNSNLEYNESYKPDLEE